MKMDMARIMNAVTADDETLGASVVAAKNGSQLPKRDEATRNRKLNALYSLQGDAREALSKALQMIDRKMYTVNGISSVEHRRQVEEEIARWGV